MKPDPDAPRVERCLWPWSHKWTRWTTFSEGRLARTTDALGPGAAGREQGARLSSRQRQIAPLEALIFAPFLHHAPRLRSEPEGHDSAHAGVQARQRVQTRQRHAQLRREPRKQRVAGARVGLGLKPRRLVDEDEPAVFAEDWQSSNGGGRPRAAQRSSVAGAEPVVRCTSSTNTGSVANCSRSDCFTNSS